ncbi:MAG: adenylate kinase [Parcubacteria group bacterium Gr01-1014_56]|nr:MAG: adenylate kinase [Parcubacteria group bacterium Gr01-1014_56]
MMGPPGSGKGTQGKLLADKIGAQLYSSGARFRELSAEASFLGKKVKSEIDMGGLLPHWLASFLYEQTLFSLEPGDGIVFEGACRTLLEAERFEEVAAWLGRSYQAIFIDVQEEPLYKRLTQRHAIEHRADDAADVIKSRFTNYRNDTKPAIDFFRGQGTLVTVSGEDTIENVHQSILKALKLS